MAERLIDEKALREKLYEWCGNHCNNRKGCQYCDISEIIDIVEEMPTIEAKPVVHAHWNEDGRCTNCGEHAPFLLYADTWYESEYCHGCGAQMDEGVKIPVISMEDVPKIMKEMEQ